MIVLIDDIKIRREDEFLAYIDSMFPDAQIDSLEKFREYLASTDKSIEFLVSDYNELDDTSLADKVLDILNDASDAKDGIKVTQM